MDVVTKIVKQPVTAALDVSDEFFDAPDHFSDDESDFDEEQAPEDDISDMMVNFLPFAVWNNSEANEVEYILPPNFGELRSKLLCCFSFKN
jgi:hypothetical protein